MPRSKKKTTKQKKKSQEKSEQEKKDLKKTDKEEGKNSSTKQAEKKEILKKSPEKEVTLDTLNVIAIDGIDVKYENRLKKAGIVTLTDLMRADPFTVYEKVKLPIHKLMEFKKKAELILRLYFDEKIIDILAAKNYTIEQAIEVEPNVLKEIVKRDLTSVIEFLENLVQITIYLDAVTCRSRSIAILHRSKVELELTREQMLAKIYSNQIGRAVLNLLQERARSRKELETLLEDLLIKTKTTKTAFNDLLDLFVRTEIVQEEWIAYELYLFLIADFTLYRRPALKILEKAKENLPTPMVAEKYIKEADKFFLNYKTSNTDNLIIAENLKRADVIELLTLLREKPYMLKSFPKISEYDATQVRTLLNSLQENGIVKIIKDEKNEEWVFLVTDITAKVFYPEYLIENIRKDEAQKKLSSKLAIKHLDLLEHNYDTFFRLL